MGGELKGFLPGRHAIEAYGRGGFSFGGMTHRGSILALPSGVYSWDALTPADLDCDRLLRVFQEPQGSIAHLVVGTGAAFTPLAPQLRTSLREIGVIGEAMATGAAIRTYNILLGEKRLVAAALLATQ